MARSSSSVECQRLDTDGAARGPHWGAEGWLPHHFGILDILSNVQKPLVSLCTAESSVGVLQAQERGHGLHDSTQPLTEQQTVPATRHCSIYHLSDV